MDSSTILESINSSINSLYSSLIHSFSSDTFEILDNITFINSDIINNKYFKNFLDYKSQSILYIVNSLLIAFLIYYAISFLFSHFFGNSVENPLQFLIKFTVCAICINFSYFICEQIINIFEIITNLIREYAFSIFSIDVSFSYLAKQLDKLYIKELTSSSAFMFSFDGILQLFITFGFFNLLFTYSYRYILIKLLILLSPFFILSFCLNSTKWLFKMWLKNFISMLSIQIIVSLLLTIIISLKYSFDDSTIKILYIGALYTLMKVSSFVKDFSSGFTTDITTNISSIKNILN